MIAAEYIYTEAEAIRGSEELMKCLAPGPIARLIIPLVGRFQLRKSFRQNPNANKKIVWCFDEEKVKDSTDGASSVRLWRKFIEVKEVRDGFLIFPQARLAHWIPKTAFSSEDDIIHFRDLVRGSGLKYNARHQG